MVRCQLEEEEGEEEEGGIDINKLDVMIYLLLLLSNWFVFCHTAESRDSMVALLCSTN